MLVRLLGSCGSWERMIIIREPGFLSFTLHRAPLSILGTKLRKRRQNDDALPKMPIRSSFADD